MSFIINQGFSLKSPQFNFERDYFKDVASLKAAAESDFPDYFITNVAGVLYQLKKSNSVDATTGKWRRLATTSGNGVTVDSALSSTSTNPVQNKAIQSKLSGHENSIKANANGITELKKDVNTINTSISNLGTRIDAKADKTVASQGANGLLSAADKKKLDGIATGGTADSAISNDYIDSLFTTAASADTQSAGDGSGEMTV